MLQNKKACLILCWNFLVLTVFHYLAKILQTNDIHFKKDHFLHSGLFFLPVLTFYPVVGLLADSCCGRYKAIKVGMWLMWGTSFFLSLPAIAKFLHGWEEHIAWGYFKVALFILLSVGMSMFQANIIQLGVDQLIDASSTDITSFINWYIWSFFGSELVVDMTQYCALKDKFQALSSLVLPTFLTVAIVFDICFGRNLVVEPTTYNPFRLIRDVLCYAAKNKYPRQRSAFTYWDHRRFSRIDLAKTKYGGPFLNEEVENVKTFFRMLVIISLMSFFIGSGYMYTVFLGKSSYKDAQDNTQTCYKILSIMTLGSCLVILFIPVYELMVYPLFPNYFLKWTSRRKFIVGILCMVLFLFIDLILLYRGKQPDCILKAETKNLIYLLPIPEFFEGLAKILLFGSTIEFVCAQAPYSMKGLLFGMAYALFGVFCVLIFLTYLIFLFLRKHHQLQPLGCLFWFLLTFMVAVLIFGFLFLLANCTYKKRQRSENLPSEHYFAEDYYGRSVAVETFTPVQNTS